MRLQSEWYSLGRAVSILRGALGVRAEGDEEIKEEALESLMCARLNAKERSVDKWIHVEIDHCISILLHKNNDNAIEEAYHVANDLVNALVENG